MYIFAVQTVLVTGSAAASKKPAFCIKDQITLSSRKLAFLNRLREYRAAKSTGTSYISCIKQSAITI